jgi:hypothetical protein
MKCSDNLLQQKNVDTVIRGQCYGNYFQLFRPMFCETNYMIIFSAYYLFVFKVEIDIFRRKYFRTITAYLTGTVTVSGIVPASTSLQGCQMVYLFSNQKNPIWVN